MGFRCDRTIGVPVRRDPEDSGVALAESGRLDQAARDEATRESRLLTCESNEVVREYPDGRCEVLETLPLLPPFNRPKGVGRICNSHGSGDHADDRE